LHSLRYIDDKDVRRGTLTRSIARKVVTVSRASFSAVNGVNCGNATARARSTRRARARRQHDRALEYDFRLNGRYASLQTATNR
jgi:hypothetical protein